MSLANVIPITPLILCLLVTFTPTSASDITLSTHRTTIKAQIGEELRITCGAVRCEKPEFIWASLMDNTLSGTVSTVGQKSILTMTVSSGSDGSYRCTVSCNKAPGEKSFKIVVYSFPSDPILHISSSVVGEQSRITCTLPNVYPSVRMTAKIMLGTEEVVEYNGAELAEYDQEINSISFFHDLVLEESYEAKKIECVAEMAFDGNEIKPVIRHTSMDLKLMHPPVKPQIRLHPSRTVRAGEEISLACISESGSQAYIQWLRLVDGKEWEMPTDDQGILTLSSVEPEDSGVYICCAKNNVGETSSQVEITVQDPPVKPQIRLHPSTTVRAGEEISLACSSESGSQAYIQWLRLVDGKEREMPTDEQGILTLSSVGPEDSGVYICCAKNNVGESSTEVEITVQGLPEIPKIAIQPGATVTAGQAVIIACFANGNTNVTLWKLIEGRNILLLDKEGKFFIKVADPADTAVYRCTAENQYGLAETSESLTVTYPPRETVLSSSAMDVNEGDTVTLSCVSKGDPKPSISLYTLSLSGESVLLSDGPVVTLTNVTSGIYQCQASNLLGRQEDTLELRVQVPHGNTTVIVTPSQNIKEGDTVIITCQTHNIPSPTIILQKVCATNSTVLYASNGTFTLHNVTRNDTGTYALNVISSIGNETGVISIFVAERQQSPGFNPISVILASIAFLSAGIIGMLIYHHKQAKVQGSYSLVKALRSKV